MSNNRVISKVVKNDVKRPKILKRKLTPEEEIVF